MQLSAAKQALVDKYVRGDLASILIPPKPKRRASESVPASLSQEQVWLRAQAAIDMPPLYNETITIHRSGPMDIAALKQSLGEILRRHEAWRTTFEMRDGQVWQVVHPVPAEFPLSAVDLRGKVSSALLDAEALKFANEHASQPFDLQGGPLARGLLVSMTDQRHCLYIDMHQSIVDGISVYEVLPTELATLYESFSRGSPAHLPDLPMQFADFALWQRDFLKEEVFEGQLNYWRKQLGDGVSTLSWPTDRPRPPVESYRGAIRPFTYSSDLLAMLNEARGATRVSLFAVLVTALAALLRTYTNQNEIVLGTLAPCGRDRSEFQNLLGYFLNPVALRLTISRSLTFRELLLQAQDVIAAAISHSDVPFEHVVQHLGLNSDPSRHPVFQVAISLAPSLTPLPAGWDMTPMDVESGGARWDLYLELSERPEGLLGRAQYNPDLFELSTITRLLNDFQALLEIAGSEPDKPISDLSV
ncbi:MAG TPA: condensation domain-containing protein [Terriglobales bacterium]|jgi:hypothetical protein|nr:condensation domain-containing protein [Terriglobales bacterium]